MMGMADCWSGFGRENYCVGSLAKTQVRDVRIRARFVAMVLPTL